MIASFTGTYKFLSNFYPCSIEYDGIVYPTLEHAYQAAKTEDNEERLEILECNTAGRAKRMGQKVTLRADWEDIKLDVMLELLRTKFKNKKLRMWLITTGDATLIEGNYWHDNFYGECYCAGCGGNGQNHLGKHLMFVRKECQEAEDNPW